MSAVFVNETYIIEFHYFLQTKSSDFLFRIFFIVIYDILIKNVMLEFYYF